MKAFVSSRLLPSLNSTCDSVLCVLGAVLDYVPLGWFLLCYGLTIWHGQGQRESSPVGIPGELFLGKCKKAWWFVFIE